MYNNRALVKNKRGAAISEFLVLLIILAPIYFLFPYLAKFISISQINLQASRYALWERTVWSAPKDQLKNNANIKSDEIIRSEIVSLFYVNKWQGLNDVETRIGNLWLPNYMEANIHKNNKVNLNLSSNTDLSPVGNYYSDRLAYGRLESFDFMPHFKTPGCIKLDDVNVTSGLDLSANTYSTVSVSVEVDMSMFNEIPGNNKEVLVINNGGILTNDWSSKDRKMFGGAVLNLVPDEMLSCAEKTASILGVLPIYKEGKLSKKANSWVPIMP